MAKNYTGIIEIIVTERDERPEAVPATRGQERRITTDTIRAKNEVARIVVKADTLDRLVAKIKGHVDLVTED